MDLVFECLREWEEKACEQRPITEDMLAWAIAWQNYPGVNIPV